MRKLVYSGKSFKMNSEKEKLVFSGDRKKKEKSLLREQRHFFVSVVPVLLNGYEIRYDCRIHSALNH